MLPEWTAIGVAVAPGGAPAAYEFSGEWFECGTEARVAAAGDIDVLEPCDGHHHYVFPNGTSAVTDVDVASLLQLGLHAGLTARPS